MKKQFLVYILVLVNSTLSAQLYEIGIFAGGSNYIGDIGSTNYINPNRIAFGGVAKFNWTPQISVRGTMTYTSLRGDDSKSNNSFRENRGLSFTNTVVDGALGIEFNFFKYNLAKTGFTQTPYIIAQIGLSSYLVRTTNSEVKRVITPVLPFGLGYKMKLAENLGIAFETSVRYTFKDEIDYNNHQIPGFTFGNSNSDDWYVFTGLSIVYAFGRPGCYTGVF